MTLLRGRFTRLILFNVAVNHCSGRPEPRTTLTEEALGANAAADAGNSCGGIVYETFLDMGYKEKRPGESRRGWRLGYSSMGDGVSWGPGSETAKE